MKKIAWFLLCMLYASTAYNQPYVLASRNEIEARKVYIGLPNQLRIVSRTYGCKNIILTTDNGTIRPHDECGSFDWMPDTPGRGFVYVRYRTPKGEKELGKEFFRVENIHDPVAEVAGKSGGAVRKDVFAVQLGVVASVPGLCTRFVVQSFSLLVVRRNEIIFAKKCAKGPLFTAKMKDFLKNKLEVGDVVLIFDISSIGPDKKLRAMSPVQFTMI